jgi:cell division protein FtsQ
MTKDKLEKKIASRRKFTIMCILVIFIGLLINIFLKSNYFVINNIIVEENSFVSQEEIIVLSELQKKNIFLFNKKYSIDRIKTNPYIKNVVIKRKFPSSAVIYVEEKQIKGLVKLKTNFINIDKDGNMVHIVDKFPNGKIPLIEGLKVDQYKINQSIADGNDTILNALKSVLKITDYKECKNLFYSINLSDPYSITLTTRDGVLIKIGDWTNLEYKLAYALVILQSPITKENKGYIEIEPDGTAVFKKY